MGTIGKLLLALVTGLPLAASAQSGWRQIDGTPIAETEARQSRDGFSAALVLTPDQDCRRVCGHDPTAHKIVEGHLGLQRDAVGGRAAVHDGDPRDRCQRRPAPQSFHLPGELVRQPAVIVVAEGHQLTGSLGDAAVSSTGQPGSSRVRDDFHSTIAL